MRNPFAFMGLRKILQNLQLYIWVMSSGVLGIRKVCPRLMKKSDLNRNMYRNHSVPNINLYLSGEQVPLR